MRSTSTVNPDRFAGGAVGVAVVFVGLYLFFVRTYDGQMIDQLAYDGADYGWRTVTPFTRRLLDALPTISGIAGLILTVVIALARRSPIAMIVALGAAGAATATAQILKHGILSRPDFGVEGFAGNSFPSGHTTVAAASALAVFLVSAPRARPTVAAWGTAFTVLAGVSTLANQWHRPSDVIAALLVVAFWGCVAGAVLAAMRPTGSGRGSAPHRAPGRRRWWLVVPFLLVTVVAFVITFVTASTSGSPTSTLIAYIGGATAIIASGVVLALVATRVFARLP